ncbi:MAG: S8 family serine peptidase, partial [Bacteroidota bacterium]
FKPEVVAPGYQIRSSGLNGQYFNLTGTSMATPHVAGALLLLKEAFPDLTGTQLKYALYNSAVDLGSPGEDNVYGQGIINVKAAFDTLVAQGNVPQVISDANDAAIIELNGLAELLCDSIVQPQVIIGNEGDNPITSLWIHWEDQNGSADSIFWSGNMAIGATDTIDLPTQILSPGVYSWSYDLRQVNGGEDYRFLNNRRLINFIISADQKPDILPVPNVCQGNEALLISADGRDLYWYEDAFSGTPIAEGTTYLSPALQQSRTYYAAAIQAFSGGKSDNTSDQGNYNESGANLWFDASRDFLLQSVLVYSTADGIRTFELRDKSGNVLASKDIFLNFGPRRIQLDFEVPARDSLWLGVTVPVGSPQLFTSTDNVSYPYEVPQVLQVIGSSLGQNQYPYCYDWEIEYAGCQVPISVKVVSGQNEASFTSQPELVYLANGGTVQFNESSFGATAWQWHFGDGDTSTLANPTHSYSAPGWYTVYLQTVGADNCSAVTQDSIRVVDWALSNELEPNWKIAIFPNPSFGELLVELQQQQAKSVQWSLVDIQGRNLQSGSWEPSVREAHRLDLSELPTGIYLLRLSDGEQVYLERV